MNIELTNSNFKNINSFKNNQMINSTSKEENNLVSNI